MKKLVFASIVFSLAFAGTAFADVWDLGTYRADNGQEITIYSTGWTGLMADILINYDGDWHRAEDLDFYYANDSETLAVFREESSWHWELEWTEEGSIAREVEDRYLDGQAGAINGLYKKEDIT